MEYDYILDFIKQVFVIIQYYDDEYILNKLDNTFIEVSQIHTFYNLPYKISSSFIKPKNLIHLKDLVIASCFCFSSMKKEGLDNIDISDIFDDETEYQNTTVGPSILIHFVEKELSLYIYDLRGGILISDFNNKSKFSKLFKLLLIFDIFTVFTFIFFLFISKESLLIFISSLLLFINDDK
mgnify:CR=1 FL=1